jgi:hypothetical protein
MTGVSVILPMSEISSVISYVSQIKNHHVHISNVNE